MAIPAELSPELMDPRGLDAIITSPYDLAHAQQLAEWGLPVRPALGHDRRRRQAGIESILAQNSDANTMRYDLAQGQLDNDARKMDFDLAAAVAPALAETNEQGMAQLGPIQSITNDGGAGLDAILGSGDLVNRSKLLADAAKARAEAESEPIKAQAAMINAQNDDGGDFEAEYGPDGSVIGIKQKNMDAPPNAPVNKSQGSFDDPTQTPTEIPSNRTSGRRLIRNSDGSGIIITEDGQRVPVTPENMKAYGF